MKIATFNANSIRSRLPILCDWLEKHGPDVVGVQETKVQDEDFPVEAFSALGYHVVFKGEKSYNGVALISREEPVDVRFGFDDGGPKDETRLVRARIGEYDVVNTYVPQGRAIDHVMYRYKVSWYDRVKRMLEREYAASDALIWLGDMNIALTPNDVTQPQTKMNDPCFHEDARQAFLSVCSLGFEDLLRKHHPDETLFSFFDYRVKDAVERNLGWRIDYILASEALAARSIDCWIDVEPRRMEKPSDHTFVVAEFL